MNEFICILKPNRLEMLTDKMTDEEKKIISAHFDYWNELCNENRAKFAGRTQTADEHTFGVVIFYAKSNKDADQLVAFDPAIRNNIMSGKVYPFVTAIE
jgi:uncharacterized protein YciI